MADFVVQAAPSRHQVWRACCRPGRKAVLTIQAPNPLDRFRTATQEIGNLRDAGPSLTESTSAPSAPWGSAERAACNHSGASVVLRVLSDESCSTSVIVRPVPHHHRDEEQLHDRQRDQESGARVRRCDSRFDGSNRRTDPCTVAPSHLRTHPRTIAPPHYRTSSVRIASVRLSV